MTVQTERSSRLRPGRVAIYIIMIAFALFYLLPVYLLLITGMKSFEEVSLSRMWDLPNGLGFDVIGAILIVIGIPIMVGALGIG